MLSYTANKHVNSQGPLLVMGLGGVGHNLLQILRGSNNMHWKLCSVQADQRLLDSCDIEQKISIGQQLTRGLGCGGDPELGALAMQQSASQLESLLANHKVLLLGVGLGGGTGSGAAPVIARMARENGVYVVVFACVPFSFEGRRRLEQAKTALGELSAAANALIVFENDRMGELLVESSGVEAAFASSNKLMANAMQSIARIATRPGLIHLGLDDLASVLRGRRTRVLYGYAEAEGNQRAQTALKEALASPLIERKHHFGECKQVVVHVCVGKDVKLSEIEQLMRDFSQHLGHETQLHFGLAVVEELESKLALSIISALPEHAAWQGSVAAASASQLGLGQLGQQLAAQPAPATTPLPAADLPGMPHRSGATPSPTAAAQAVKATNLPEPTKQAEALGNALTATNLNAIQEPAAPQAAIDEIVARIPTEESCAAQTPAAAASASVIPPAGKPAVEPVAAEAAATSPVPEGLTKQPQSLPVQQAELPANTPAIPESPATKPVFPAFPAETPADATVGVATEDKEDEVDIKAMVALANKLAERDFDDEEDLDIPPSLRNKKG